MQRNIGTSELLNGGGNKLFISLRNDSNIVLKVEMGVAKLVKMELLEDIDFVIGEISAGTRNSMDEVRERLYKYKDEAPDCLGDTFVYDNTDLVQYGQTLSINGKIGQNVTHLILMHGLCSKKMNYYNLKSIVTRDYTKELTIHGSDLPRMLEHLELRHPRMLGADIEWPSGLSTIRFQYCHVSITSEEPPIVLPATLKTLHVGFFATHVVAGERGEDSIRKFRCAFDNVPDSVTKLTFDVEMCRISEPKYYENIWKPNYIHIIDFDSFPQVPAGLKKLDIGHVQYVESCYGLKIIMDKCDGGRSHDGRGREPLNPIKVPHETKVDKMFKEVYSYKKSN